MSAAAWSPGRAHRLITETVEAAASLWRPAAGLSEWRRFVAASTDACEAQSMPWVEKVCAAYVRALVAAR